MKINQLIAIFYKFTYLGTIRIYIKKSSQWNMIVPGSMPSLVITLVSYFNYLTNKFQLKKKLSMQVLIQCEVFFVYWFEISLHTSKTYYKLIHNRKIF